MIRKCIDMKLVLAVMTLIATTATGTGCALKTKKDVEADTAQAATNSAPAIAGANASVSGNAAENEVDEADSEDAEAVAATDDDSVPSEEAAVPVTPVNDNVPSFRVSDPEGPKVTDEELEQIPTEINPLVEKWVSYFKGRGRPHMERYLSRSTRYEKLMKKVLRDNGLPEDLFYVALIESGFSSQATSRAAAVGYWQFIRGTGKRYGLEINRLVDERRDPVLATQAAAEYFKGLYSVFGSWYLAMASYNVGENRVKREVMKHMTRDFWELARRRRLPKETINYIPKFIAAKMIAKNPEQYGFGGIDYLPPIEFDHVTVDYSVNTRVLAEKLGANYEDFKALNPKFRGEIAPIKNASLTLRVPPGQVEAALAVARESLVEKVEFVADADETQTYRIRRGDTLGTIARRYRTTIAYIRDINDLPNGRKLRVGARLMVPDRTPLRDKSVRMAGKSVRQDRESASEKLNGAKGRFHIVQSGESLFSIAARYNTTISELKRLNNLRNGRTLRAGSRLLVPGGDGKEAGDSTSSTRKSVKFHVVRKGETLKAIAQLYNISQKTIVGRNSLRNPSKLMAGVKLVIPRRD